MEAYSYHTLLITRVLYVNVVDILELWMLAIVEFFLATSTWNSKMHYAGYFIFSGREIYRLPEGRNYELRTCVNRVAGSLAQGGRTRADKIGVGAGGDIGGTDISCIFMARQYTRPTWQSYRDDLRHVGVMPATPSINTPARCAEQVRTRLPCDARCFVASLEKIGSCSFVRLCNRSL